LLEQIAAVRQQEYAGLAEVIIADNGSTDALRQAIAQISDGDIPLVYVDCGARRGRSFARNRGASAARGDILAFCDADDVVNPSWLRALAAQLVWADIAYGVVELHPTVSEPMARAYRDDPFHDESEGENLFGYLPFAPSGNMAVWRHVFECVGGFSEEFSVGEDIDFSWRAQRLGFKLGVTSGAVLRLRMRESPWRFFKQQFAYGRGNSLLYARHGQFGMRRARISVASRSLLQLVRDLPRLRTSADARARVAHIAGRRLGRIAGSVEHGTFFY
jgi:glycosyltransferase involved in cell wall biosynthesis